MNHQQSHVSAQVGFMQQVLSPGPLATLMPDADSKMQDGGMLDEPASQASAAALALAQWRECAVARMGALTFIMALPRLPSTPPAGGTAAPTCE